MTDISLAASDAPVQENFDSLPATGTGIGTAAPGGGYLLPNGWVFLKANAPTNASYATGAGASNGGNVYSLGTGTAGERALGSVGSGTPGTIYFGTSFVNNTGAAITSLDIGYFGELWRSGGRSVANGIDRLDFQISFDATGINSSGAVWEDVDALDFVSPAVLPSGAAAVDGNANRTSIGSSIATNIPAGATFWLRFVDLDATGNDDGLAVDDFTLTPRGAAAALPTLSIDDVTTAEGDAGTVTYTFTVGLSAPAGPGGVTFDIATADGTAIAATGDYVARTLAAQVIPEGSTTYTFTVTVNGDTTVEPNEIFLVNVTNVTGATVTDGQGVGTIVNDDSAPAGTFAIAAAAPSVAEGDAGATAVTFTVTRSGGTVGAVVIAYTVIPANGATVDDFVAGQAFSGTVEFGDGDGDAKTITVQVNGDAAVEPDEAVTVTLGAPSAGTLGQASATTVIANDDSSYAIAAGSASEAAGAVPLVVTRTGLLDATTLTYTVSLAPGDTASAEDFPGGVLPTGQVVFAAGATQATISVPVVNDTTTEPNETFTVTLSGARPGQTIAVAGATGTIVNDDGAPVGPQLLFATDFAGFTAAGFASNPGAGQLSSNIWRIVGLSDLPNPAYGFTSPAGANDFSRGVIQGSADPTGGGTYSPSANAALVLQPTGTDFFEGTGAIEARIQNTSGFTAVSFDVQFDWAFRNSGGRAEGLQLSYSSDGVNFAPVPASAITTPGTQDATVAATFTNTTVQVAFDDVAVVDGGYLYLRWTHTSSTGGGNRDEVGIDNVSVRAGLSDASVLTFGDLQVAEGADDTGFAVFTLTRTRTDGAASVDFATADGVALAGSDYVAQSGTIAFADGEATRTIRIQILGDARNEPDEAFFINFANASGFLLPDSQARVTIVNDDLGPVPIYDIQGLGHQSTYVGLSVTTSGVVTAVRATGSDRGYYLQDPNGDGDTRTSDAIFVSTGAVTPTVAVGNAITLTGTVGEYTANALNLTVTRLVGTSNVVVTNASAALPAAVLISTEPGGYAPPTEVIDDDRLQVYDPANDAIDFYESLEGMLVTVRAPLVVGTTDGVGQTYVVANRGIGATGVNDRFGISIAAGDNAPEKIKIFNPGGGAFTQGDVLNDVTGILTYFGSTSGTSASYEVDPIGTVTAALDRPLPAREATTLVGDGAHLTFVSFNVENLGPVATRVAADTDATYANKQAIVDARFATHAREVVSALKTPDILALQEIQDADGENAGTDLSGAASAQKLIDAIAAAGGPTYRYVEVAPTATNISGGAPNGNIRNGYLYNPERVSYVEGSAQALTDPAYNGTRKPLVADFLFNGELFTAANMHSTSRGGSDTLFGANQPPNQLGDAARTAQAAALRGYVDSVLQNDPDHKFVVAGDFNGYYYEDALQRLQAGGVLVNLYDKLPVEERYSYYFDGYYQAFDNILVSGGLVTGTDFDVVHYNAGYSDGLSATDHDQPVARIGLARADGVATAVADAFATTEAAILRGTVLANDTGGGAGLRVESVDGVTSGTLLRLASGALVRVAADGSFVYDADGAFSALGAGQTATDQFSYVLTGGSQATVTVTITGIPDAQPTAGDDVIAGTTGDDFFAMGAGGVDKVSGGAGNDAFYFGTALTAGDQVNGGSGADVLAVQGNYAGLVLGAGNLVGVETLTFLSGADARFGDVANSRYSYDIRSVDANVAAGERLIANGAALLAGESLVFDGSAETDGSFLIYGGRGTDTLTGGANADLFFMADGRFNAGDRIVGGGGNDIVVLRGDYAGDNAVTLADNTLTSVETVTLQSAADTRFFAGGTRYAYDVTSANGNVAAGAVLTVNGAGLQADETMRFDGSAETDGAFHLFGGAGTDVLIGGVGNDLIYGGQGADTLTGGGGNDVFRFDSVAESTPDGRDGIQDFGLGDLIDLSRIDANGLTADDDAFGFIGGDAFTGVAGQLRAVQGDGGSPIWTVSGDVDGDGIADFELAVVVVDGHQIGTGDFLL